MSINWDKIVEENRLGKFSIQQRDLLEYPNYFNKAFERFLIVDGQFRYDINGCRYVAYSPFFDEVEEGLEAKNYRLPIESYCVNGEPFIKINWQEFGRDEFFMPNIDKEVYNYEN